MYWICLVIIFVQDVVSKNSIFQKSGKPFLLWTEVGGAVSKIKHVPVPIVNRQISLPLGEVLLETSFDKIRVLTLDNVAGILLIADVAKKEIKQIRVGEKGFRECVLYRGTSRSVSGMAIDGSTKSLYWTDPVYDVILVQNYGECPPKHPPIVLMESGLDEPTGIVSHIRESRGAAKNEGDPVRTEFESYTMWENPDVQYKVRTVCTRQKHVQRRETNQSSDAQNQSSDAQNQSSDAQNQSSDAQNQSSDAQNQSSDAQNQSSDAQNQSSDAQNQSSDAQNQSSDAQNQSSDAQNQSSDAQNQSSEVDLLEIWCHALSNETALCQLPQLLFWSDAGTSPSISRSSLSGKGRTAIVERDLKKPNHLALDLRTNRLYWLDGGSGRLSSCDPDGGRRMSLLRIERAVFGGLAVYKHNAYVTDRRRRAIYVTNTHTGATTRRLVLQGNPYSVLLVGQQFTDIETDDCNQCNGVCVRNGINGTECLCPNRQKGSPKMECNVMSKSHDLFLSPVMFSRRYGVYSLMENFADLRYPLSPRGIVYSKSYRPSLVSSNVHKGDIYFTERKTKAIIKVPSDEKTKVKQIALSPGEVDGLVVDWVSGNLYWTDRTKAAILVSSDQGRHVKYFIHREPHAAKFLAINPGRRKLYWLNTKPALESCYLDGSYRESIVTGRILQPTALVLDIRHDRLYWADAGFGRIVTSNLDGSDTRTLHTAVTSTIKAMAVVKDYLVYADWFHERRGLHAINTKTGQQVGHYPDGGLIRGLHFHHHSNQPLFHNPCGQTNGGCDHLCLPNFYNYTCACAFGYQLATDNAMCETDLFEDKFILIADQRMGGIFQLDLWRYQYHAVPLQTLHQPYSVIFNPIEKKVYWSDVMMHTINRAYQNGSHQEVIFARNNLSVVRLALEENAGLLFYLDIWGSALGVIALSGLHHRTLITNLTANDFVVDAEHGLLLVSTDDGTARYNMEGTQVDFAENPNQRTGLSWDVSSNACSGKNRACSHICLPVNGEFKCACPDGMLQTRDKARCYMQAVPMVERKGFCVIPRVEFGVIVEQKPGAFVEEDFVIAVRCLEGRLLSSDRPITCVNGAWTFIPSCTPAHRNPIYGTERRGQRVFTHSGVFVPPAGVDQVNVICIGGGGGGRDGRSFRDAGNGGSSSFGHMLVAEGGTGGKANNSGGLGGKGTVAGGGDGRLHADCGGAGGAAGETTTNGLALFPGVSTFMFCGGGGTSDPVCLKQNPATDDISPGRSGPGGKDGVEAAGGLYGGGSGGAAGGRGGGGGGYSFATIQLRSRTRVRVTVGEAGTPSFAPPGRGIVVVAWGGEVDTLVHRTNSHNTPQNIFPP